MPRAKKYQFKTIRLCTDCNTRHTVGAACPCLADSDKNSDAGGPSTPTTSDEKKTEVQQSVARTVASGAGSPSPNISPNNGK